MSINEIVEQAKITGDEKLINELIKYYEPIFCKNVSKHYGKDYVEDAKKALPSLIDYYLNNNLKDSLNGFLYKKAGKFFYHNYNFNKIINSDEKEKIRKYYTDKLYKIIKTRCEKLILSNKEIYALSSAIVSIVYNNYLKTPKQSDVSNYFNSMIYRKLVDFSEERLYLMYVKYVGITDKIINYFYYKYMYLLKEHGLEETEEYEKDVIDTLKTIKTFYSFFESHLRTKLKQKVRDNQNKVHEEIEKLKNGQEANIGLIKEHYSYIKDDIFKRFENEVCISKETLREIIDKKYDDYFLAAVNYANGKKDASLAKYINTRLTEHIKNGKKFFRSFTVDYEEKEKNTKANMILISKYAIKYAGICPKEVLINNLTIKYSSLADDYYLKPRNTPFKSFVRKGLHDEAKRLVNVYIDDASEDFNKDDNVVYKKTF